MHHEEDTQFCGTWRFFFFCLLILRPFHIKDKSCGYGKMAFFFVIKYIEDFM